MISHKGAKCLRLFLPFWLFGCGGVKLTLILARATTEEILAALQPLDSPFTFLDLPHFTLATLWLHHSLISERQYELFKTVTVLVM